ncbi:hypothetical protein ACJMK2_009277 [Sinanodonta woodiana]|uniref:Transcription factor CBF/NF-Y/archaeal histone domain-containing protein n=1 Tax=Sinanodonta woodiana TaxID=1069815 RepID=A0ABD3VBR9_SINWO
MSKEQDATLKIKDESKDVLSIHHKMKSLLPPHTAKIRRLLPNATLTSVEMEEAVLYLCTFTPSLKIQVCHAAAESISTGQCFSILPFSFRFSREFPTLWEFSLRYR